jgi:hypothetical protein
MKSYYRANEMDKKKLLLKWRNEQILWKAGSKAIILLSILCVAICIGIYVIITSMVDDGDKAPTTSIEFIAVMLALLFAMISAPLLFAILRKIHFKAMEPYYKRTNECIYLKDDKLIVIAHDILSEEVESVDEYSISYNNIREIQFDEQRKELRILGPTEKRYYNDYSLGKVCNQKAMVRENKINLLLYYDNENLFLEGLADRTGLPINLISKAQ